MSGKLWCRAVIILVLVTLLVRGLGPLLVRLLGLADAGGDGKEAWGEFAHAYNDLVHRHQHRLNALSEMSEDAAALPENQVRQAAREPVS